jgi:hypothetical protein
MLSVRLQQREQEARECFRTAAEFLGPVEPGMAVFGLTRGQFSMVDLVLAGLAQTGPARVSVWTWTIAAYETGMFLQLLADGRVLPGSVLVIDHGARNKNMELLLRWRAAYGHGSVRYVVNHAKIATIEGGGYRLLLRGSANLNANPKFEQFDVSEGGPAFDLVREVEDGLPVLADDATGEAVVRASRITMAWEQDKLALFDGVKRWNK